MSNQQSYYNTHLYNFKTNEKKGIHQERSNIANFTTSTMNNYNPSTRKVGNPGDKKLISNINIAGDAIVIMDWKKMNMTMYPQVLDRSHCYIQC